MELRDANALADLTFTQVGPCPACGSAGRAFLKSKLMRPRKALILLILGKRPSSDASAAPQAVHGLDQGLADARL